MRRAPAPQLPTRTDRLNRRSDLDHLSVVRPWSSPSLDSRRRRGADCLGVINDAAEFALWLSPHILASTGRVLATVVKTPDDEIDEYLQVLAEMAEASGGGITGLPQTVGDCADWGTTGSLTLRPRSAHSSSFLPMRT